MVSHHRAKCYVIHLHGDPTLNTTSSRFAPSLPTDQRGLKGHIIIFPSHPENLGQVLPPPLSKIITPICVVFVGSCKPSKEWLLQKAKPLIVRCEKVRAALIWLKHNNHLYHDISIDHTALDQILEEDALPVEIKLRPDSDSLVAVNSTYTSALHVSDSEPSVSLATLDQVMFQNAVVTDIEGNEVSVKSMSLAALNHLRAGGAYIRMLHDNVPSNEYTDYNLFPLLYPTLFPYSIGGFEHPERAVYVSMREHSNHFFRLSDRRFQEHFSFPFVVFNILQHHVISLGAKLKVSQSSLPIFATELMSISERTIESIGNRLSKGEIFKPTTHEENWL